MISRLILAWIKRLFRSVFFGRCRPIRSRLPARVKPGVELLEGRILPSGIAPLLNIQEFHDPSRVPAGLTPSALGILPKDNGSDIPLGYTPDQIRTAYGINNILFGSVTGDGKGQTIAIVDAYDDPSFVDSTASNFASSDLAQFDSQLGIPDPPSFMKVNESGQTSNLPKTDPAGAGNSNGNWEIEEALDIEWAHAVAPGANIVLVEATTDSNDNLFAAVAEAASLPGVSAVSMSWGTPEYSGQNAVDSTFVTPTGHQGVTFLAASGDNGGDSYDAQGQPNTTPGILYPAASPNVVAVGGTTLQLNADNTINSETAWSGSGGGTSIYETQPAYQQGFQSTGFRTIPDVVFDADPNTGVSVYDSYNDTDGSGAWVTIGGTSLASPSWAGLIAIVNQGRVLAGGTTLDGPSQTLPALYTLSPADFNDIASGGNGVFNAGPGYDEVTGLGSPKAAAVTADLATYGTATKIAVTAQPPSSVIVGDSFGVVVAAENSLGQVDPAFNGTLTIALAGGPAGATLGGSLTATAVHGIAVFDGLTINQLGSGYTLTISSAQFPSITTNSFAEITNPTPWQGTYYPVPTDASLRAAINAADSNAFAFNTILLSASTTLLSNTTAGALLIQNTSSLPGKTLTITGQGSTNSIIGSVYNWQDRIFQIAGSAGQALHVTLQGLTIQGGNAQNGGVLGGSNALGGGLLIDGAAVTLANDVVQNNQAQGALGAAGKAGAVGKAGAAGGTGNNAAGGAIYVASGTLSLFNDTISGNSARGGKGGEGGAGGGQGTKSAAAVTAGQGGLGGMGGSAAGGGIYAAGGTVQLENDTFRSNQAIGGPGGTGDTGGSGGHGKAGVPGKPGGIGGGGGLGGAAAGGGLYLGGGSLTLVGGTLQKNAAVGGVGGQGGAGGPGTAAGSSLTQILGGLGSNPTSLLGGLGGSGQGGSGGAGGAAGAAGAGSGGGVFVAAGSLSLVNAAVTGNQATGGQGGLGGQGGTGGFGAGTGGGTGFLTLPAGLPAGHGGAGGNGGLGQGGGILVAGGTVSLSADTWSGNSAGGGKGGTGGQGGNGPLAALGTGGSLGFGSSFGGSFPSITGGLGGGGANSAGAGGNGGKGSTGNGGGLYVSGGALTLTNNTVAGNTAQAGTGGKGGSGGQAGTGQETGGKGVAGPAGASAGGGLYVNGGTVSLDNSTVALNTQTGSGSGGGVVQSAGTVTAVSTLFAGNGSVDYSGSITATDSLFQTAPVNGTFTGSGNLVNVNPLLDPSGLKNNGGPTPTIALQPSSPAIGKGANPENLFTDQRGFAPRTGPRGTDIGAYQTSATADTQAPTATLQASAVTGTNASALNPYTFTITYSDNVAVALASLPGAIVQVLPPGSAAPILASIVSTASGSTDGLGNAQSFSVTYQITLPGGAWTGVDNGTYTVTLGGAPVIDLAGNAVATGTLGTFSVNVGVNQGPVLTAGTVSGTGGVAGVSPASLSATFTDANTAAPASNFSGTINWGDGTTAHPDITTFSASAVSGSGGSFTVSSSHQYTAAGTYPITVVINDVGGSSTTDNGSLTVTAAVPSSITATGGNNQNAPVGSAFTNPLQVTVADTLGNPVSGVSVTFTAPASGAGGTFSNGQTSITVATNASGVASAPFTADTTTGSYKVTAAVSGIATPASFSLTNTLVPAAIRTVLGTPQTATVGSAFASSLLAKVTNASGSPVVGISVTFTAPASGAGGHFSNGNTSITVTTNTSGFASATFTANTAVGSYQVTATVPGSTPASFSLTNKAGAPNSITVTSGNSQTTQVGSAFTSSLQVAVSDRYGNPVSGTSVIFMAPSSGAGGHFSNGSTSIAVATNASGIASAPFTANTAPGSYSVRASVAGSTPASFSLTNDVGAPAKITVTGGNSQTTPVGSAFATPLQVTVTDRYGNAVSNTSVTFTAPATGADGTFSNGNTSITVATNASGVASAAFAANTTPGSYKVTAAVAGSTPASFSLTNKVGAPSNITVPAGNNTQSTPVGSAFPTPLQVTVTDSYGNLVSGTSVTFTAPASGATGHFSNGSTRITVLTNAFGIASAAFTANTKPGSYSVTAAVAGVAAPAFFSLTNNVGAPAKITVTGGNSQNTAVGYAFTNPLQVTVADRYGNLVSGTSVTFTAPASGAGGTFSNGQTSITVATNAAGIASAPFTADTTTGSYKVTAAVSGIATPASFSLTNTLVPAAITGTPQTATVNSFFGTALLAKVTNASGSPVVGISVTFTAPASGASGHFNNGQTSITVTTNAAGFASVAFTANLSLGRYQVKASFVFNGVTNFTVFTLTNS